MISNFEDIVVCKQPFHKKVLMKIVDHSALHPTRVALVRKVLRYYSKFVHTAYEPPSTSRQHGVTERAEQENQFFMSTR